MPSSEFARALLRSSVNEPSCVVDDFLRADVLAQGPVNGEPTWSGNPVTAAPMGGPVGGRREYTAVHSSRGSAVRHQPTARLGNANMVVASK